MSDENLDSFPEPVSSSIAEPSSRATRKRSIWVWLGPAIGGFVIIVAIAVIVGINVVSSITTPRNETLASKVCVAEAVDQMKSPATAKVSKVLVSRGADRKAAGPTVKQWVEHASLDDADGISNAVSDYLNDDQTGLKKNVFIVSAAIDGSNSYGATVRNYVICWVGVEDSEVVTEPTVLFSSSN